MKSPSWNRINAILEATKRNSLFKLLYKIPFAPSAYHYSLALLGALIYGFPSRKIRVVGVTGTKGKTTTLELINAGLEEAGKKTALLSSVRIKLDKKTEPNLLGNTQPGRFYAQNFIKEAVNKGCQYVLLEIGSEGVVRHRHRFIDFDRAAFVNIHPEHIESHGSFERYRNAKLKFFRYVRGALSKKEKKFFVNQDDANADLFIKAAGKYPVVLTTPTQKSLKMKGNFNRENAGVAEAILRSFDIPEEQIKSAFNKFAGVPGRMEYVQEEPFAVVVDYAHTPNSLEMVYKNLKPTENKMICVLGSAGGGRDKWKRPEMGLIASKYCAKIILTNEDPFDEDPLEILEEIKTGIPEEKKGKTEIVLDRGVAIKRAISLADKGDVVIITGKGSELSIRVKSGEKIPWSDVGVVRRVLGYTKQ
ncbi:MAG: hypothetical protein COT89_01705 [Candidatus Colwellbacteria bacterium CG10_big_fil_rev_8_21_14_0_10_42_22]|uniref:UDP-N-acetylmuramoyl-L-alanyl-D-glutamate--2, 6-diaminopimelate ligase n=1 Tax=Candidatus Colwellbacteria bacterium CG10_big_fil_rev_8_21_14_0_10_42_22 TaxID=1974540 RepID=A0A2H0VHW4_9BACT|nr:MAG: hypothetical protein COT89_01705 [Candidatus Colwellbacteria bacterium CG10_big_fil_rev_8_21_14_0_10_42_22]